MKMSQGPGKPYFHWKKKRKLLKDVKIYSEEKKKAEKRKKIAIADQFLFGGKL